VGSRIVGLAQFAAAGQEDSGESLLWLRRTGAARGWPRSCCAESPRRR
jgi:hypothetical protein